MITMGNTLYLECFSGISGDMTVAALLDLGADVSVLNRVLASVPVRGFQTKISRKKLSSIDACDFDVILQEDNHDHDMNYLFNHDHEDHHHEDHHHGKHSHEHRNLSDVTDIINKTDMTDRARTIAIKVFNVLAEAEAKAHGIPVSDVHFHEVGAIDSIVDIISVAVCLDNLDITECIVPLVYEGQGFVHCQHGDIPIPVPAVLNITNAYGINMHMTDMEAELVTPTGAAIIGAVRTSDKLPEHMTVLKTGIGAGKRAYKRPSMLRAMLIESENGVESNSLDGIVKLESNIDDVTGEALGFTMEKLFAAGALDVFYVPCFMKKNRPGVLLNVLCTKDNVSKLENIIFKETTTIGIRRCIMDRTVLERQIVSVDTKYGKAKAKKVTLPDGEVRLYPEYESVKELSEKKNVSYQECLREVMASVRS